ncbi:polysaccharide deacetylase family protein [Kitasatospora sp. NBC_01560]|uniref:polysaccharide deacetylase family protein n=1 Tax=Kitasatospora sp. NBC_01560 TaxID=2975965 RepID=UPI00386EA2E8
MSEHTPSQRPSATAPRRRLVVGCVAVAAALGLAACGTASGALQPQPSVTVSGPSAPTVPPTPSTPDSSAPGSSTPGSSAPAPSAGTPSAPKPPTPAPRAPKPPTPAPRAPKPPTPAAPPPSTSRPPSKPPAQPPAPAPSTAAPAPAPPPPPPPASGVSTVVVRSTASGGRTVALTFDDGPGPATGQVLDLLAQYGAKATFCQIGRQAAANPATVKRIVAAGHRLCDHTVDHPQPFGALPHDRAGYEIAHAEEQIVQAGGAGTTVSWFRAPGGGFTADNQRIAAGLGLRPLGWSVDPRDWSRPGVASIVSTVQGQLRPGGVVLLHDGGGDRSQTVAALKQLLPWLIAQGYHFDFPAT